MPVIDGDAMNNKKGHENNEQPDSEDKSPLEDIPLWLQGLEENDPDVPVTSQSENTLDDNWFSEESQETKKNQVPINHLDEQDDSGFDIPDWLNDLSNEVTGPSESLDTESEEKEIEENTVVNHLDEFSKKSTDLGSTDEDFVEIPGDNFEDTTGLIDHFPEEEINEDGELPDWLQEMINEPVETQEENRNAVNIPLNTSVDEPTEPIEIREVPMENDFEEPAVTEIEETEQFMDIEHPEKIEETEDIEEAEVVSERDQENQKPAPIPEKSNQVEEEVVSTELEFSEPIIDQPKILEPEPVQPTKVPKTLRFAKKLLGQGDHNEALDIINTYINRGVFLNEIQLWLGDIVKDDKSSHDEVWESIGDIALKQDKPDEAFDAYTNAIKSLFKRHEENREIG